LQPPVAVVTKLHLPPMGIGALAYLATPVVLVERGVPGGVGIAIKPALFSPVFIGRRIMLVR
jgi:hypothetical protein